MAAMANMATGGALSMSRAMVARITAARPKAHTIFKTLASKESSSEKIYL
jgi:hypothetical protein